MVAMPNSSTTALEPSRSRQLKRYSRLALLFALASLWFTTALAPSIHRSGEPESGAVVSSWRLSTAILLCLLSRARRDRILAVGGLILSLLPFAGAAFDSIFSLWLSWDLRRV